MKVAEGIVVLETIPSPSSSRLPTVQLLFKAYLAWATHTRARVTSKQNRELKVFCFCRRKKVFELETKLGIDDLVIFIVN